MNRLFVLGLAACLSLPIAWTVSDAADKAEAKDKAEVRDKVDLKIEGKLSKDDPKDKLLNKSPHKVHEFKMKTDAIFIIDLKSDDFDTFLRLENSKEKQLAYNDDVGPKDLNSRIVFKAPKDDTYRIIVTSFDRKEGDYTLTVRKGTEEDLRLADPFHDLIGKPAPEIVTDFAVTGTTKKLSDLKGKVVLVDFWAVWCGPCIATFPHLQKLDKESKKDGLEILGVTTYFENRGFDKEKGKVIRLENPLTTAEENAMLKDFVAHYKLTHQIIAVDKEKYDKVESAYKVDAIPQVVLIDRKGIVRMVRVGAGPEIAAEVEEEIRKLLAEK